MDRFSESFLGNVIPTFGRRALRLCVYEICKCCILEVTNAEYAGEVKDVRSKGEDRTASRWLLISISNPHVCTKTLSQHITFVIPL
jgi:hypothetical protein